MEELSLTPSENIDARYQNGEYLEQTQHQWHDEDAVYKSHQVLKALQRAGLNDQDLRICDIGCGSGGLLIELEKKLPAARSLVGYEVSGDALNMARASARENGCAKVQFLAESPNSDHGNSDLKYDLALVMDVLEHVPDAFKFLRDVKKRADYKLFHIPLDLFCLGLLRNRPVAVWRDFGHLHRFDHDTALEILRYTGYEIVDSFFTPVALASTPRHRWTHATNIVRRALPTLWAARLVGGYSLMVLAR